MHTRLPGARICALALSLACIPVPASAQVNQALGARMDALAAQLAAGMPSRELVAINAGNAYAWSTGAVAVSSGNYLNVMIANPAGTGKTLCLVTREFNTTATAVLQYQPFLDPTALTSPTTKAGNNQLVGGGGPAASSVFTYVMQSTSISTGTSGATDFIPAAGVGDSIPFLTAITPGHSIGFSIGGAGGGLAATASVLVTFSGHERAGIGC